MIHERTKNKILGKLEIVKKMQHTMYAKCGLKIVNFSPEAESSEYYAHTFTLYDKNGLFRIAKKTPTKPGCFVTIWKRGTDNIIAPYHEFDAVTLLSLLSLTARI